MADLASKLAAVEGYAITDYGLTISKDLTENEWVEIGRRIRRRADGAAWALGDWLVYGGGRQGAGGRWIGSSYRRAMQITGYSSSHLSNAFRVCSAFPPDARVHGLTFDHHRQVLGVSEDRRQRLLDRAFANHTNARAFSTEILRIRKPRGPSRSKADYQPVQVQCPKCQHVFPARAHRYTGPRTDDGREPAVTPGRSD